MFNRLTLYWQTETEQQNQIRDVRARIQDMDVQFQIVEVQQQQLFENEKTQLEAIFAATDNLWNFNFEFRKAADEAIFGAIGETGNLITNMQEQQLKLLLEQAEASVR